jgi:anti-sigma-K factor RskA
VVNLPSRAAVLYAAGPPAPQGKDYELWVIRGDRKLPAGLLRTQPTGAILARIDAALLSEGPPDALAVTVESAGGAPQPLGPIVLAGAFPHT